MNLQASLQVSAVGFANCVQNVSALGTHFFTQPRSFSVLSKLINTLGSLQPISPSPLIGHVLSHNVYLSCEESAMRQAVATSLTEFVPPPKILIFSQRFSQPRENPRIKRTRTTIPRTIKISVPIERSWPFLFISFCIFIEVNCCL